MVDIYSRLLKVTVRGCSKIKCIWEGGVRSLVFNRGRLLRQLESKQAFDGGRFYFFYIRLTNFFFAYPIALGRLFVAPEFPPKNNLFDFAVTLRLCHWLFDNVKGLPECHIGICVLVTSPFVRAFTTDLHGAWRGFTIPNAWLKLTRCIYYGSAPSDGDKCVVGIVDFTTFDTT